MRKPTFRMAVVLLAVLLFAGVLLVSCGGGEDEAAQEAAGDAAGSNQAAETDQAAEGAGGEDATGEGAADDSQADAVIESGFETLEHQGFSLQWRVDGETLDVVLSYETSGWLSIGFDPTSMMQDANIIIGYVDGGELTISDQYGTGQTAHQADTEIGGTDDITNAEGSESGGRTELRFSIPLDSGDEADRPLSEGETYTVLLAHGPNDSDDMSTYHQGRTSVDIEI